MKRQMRVLTQLCELIRKPNDVAYLTVVMVIAVKMYVNKLKMSIVGPSAASSRVPVHCSKDGSCCQTGYM